ncbi:MAG TPA: MMPL family transporter [Bdellovibrionales bacterium]|nr:MMPL family transporter [Bdellovibrionales bacterium]
MTVVRRALNWFIGFLETSFDGAVQRPRLTVALFTVFMAACLTQLPKLKFELRMYDTMKSEFKSARALSEMRENYKEGNSAVYIFAPRNAESFTLEDVCKIRGWTMARWREDSEIESSFSAFNLRYPVFDELGRVSFPRIFSPPCDELAGPEGAGARERPVTFASLHATPWSNLLTNESGRDLAVEFTFRDTETPGPYGKFDPKPIGAVYESAVRELGAIANVFVSGKAAPQWHIKEILRKDSLLNLVIIVVLILGFRAFYGTWRSGLLLALTFIMTWVATLAGMAVVGHSIDSVSNNLFLLMCIACTEDFLFVTHYQSRKPGSLLPSFRDIIAGSFFTSLTTMTGFAALLTSDLQVIGRLGLWAAWAALVEWLVVFFFLPSFALLFMKGRTWVRPERALGTRAISGLERYTISARTLRAARWLPVAGLVAVFFLNFQDSPRRNFPESSLHARSMAYVSESRGWEGLFHIVFRDDSKRKSIDQALAKIEALPNVASVSGPFQAKEFFASGYAPLVSEMLGRAFEATGIHKAYFGGDGSARANVFVKSVDLKDIGPTVDAAESLCASADCYVAGEQVAYTDFARTVSRTLFESFLLSILSVLTVIFALAYARGYKDVWPLVLSAVWAPLVMAAVMAVFQVPINLFTSMFASVYVGIAGDNAIQYMFASRELEQGIEERAGGSVQMAILMILGSCAFFGSGLVPLKLLGVLFAAGFFVMLAGDLWLLRGLIGERAHEDAVTDAGGTS